MEDILARPDHEDGGLSPALEAVRQAAGGLSWAFLTLLFPDDRRNYHIVAASGDVPDSLPAKAPMNSGLAGWVHSNLKHLGLPLLKAESRSSYIFTKEEPIRGVKSFYGWPVIYNGNLRGVLILAGREGETLTPEQAEIAECAAARFAAQMHLDHLIARFADMGGVDSQTNLSHRGYFVEDLNRMMGVADLKGEEMNLFVLATSGLGSFSCEHGQAAAAELLRSIAKELKDGLRETWALGHVSYGVFTLAIPSSDLAEAKKLIKKFQAQLGDWPLSRHSGRASLGLFLAMASYPRDAAGPEELLEAALTALADGDDDDDAAEV
jgi:GGDEF domain-containing protein